ncbi:MAG: chemotaxis protein CheW [Gammaproteobacteria bacterium]|uniref:chemotaxis protein CheW n=1 Tax=unclassified Pseudacidovorax TaxID=2620592 RepID=UPI003394738A
MRAAESAIPAAELAAQMAQTGILTFRLDTEHYGIDILKVQEIRSYEPVTRIPQADPAVRGVINLRGAIVPIVDLRLRFGLPQADCDRFTAVIIVNVGAKVIGMVVDGVSEVVTLAAEQVQPRPDMAAVDLSCITGLATLQDRMVMLLDLEALLAHVAQ